MQSDNFFILGVCIDQMFETLILSQTFLLKISMDLLHNKNNAQNFPLKTLPNYLKPNFGREAKWL